MARVSWTSPALQDLDEIADHIALEHAPAARRLVQKIFERIDELADFPRLGPILDDLETDRYRQILEYPCRVIYRFDGENKIYILHVVRTERFLKLERIEARESL